MATGLFTLRQQNQAIRQKAWSGTQKTNYVEYLVVAGGGGGGGNSGGGGGAGGLLTGILNVTTGSSITATVGGGGSGQSTAQGTSGQNSVFGSITANGGGGGGGTSTNGLSGGSGGGGSLENLSVAIGGQGISGQGNAGGGGTATSNAPCGGGGGAGTVGLNIVSSSNAGNGGAGIASAINGTVTTYAGGGGGGVRNSQTAGTGGVGGGGAGSGTGAGTAGTTNTGGGGGGASGSGAGGNGGSGIVIVSYPDTYAAPTATTGSPTVSTSGSGSISFNGAGTQSVNYAGQTPFSLGTGDFTIECWVYFNSLSGTPFVVDFRNGSVSSGSVIFISGANTLTYYDPGATVTIGTVATSTWYHVAVTRNGTSLRTFLNGTLANTASDSQNLSVGSDRPVIGGYGPDPSQSPLNGYVSNFRVIKGTAIYTASFTAPTAPLTAVSGTSLLLNTVSGAYLADGSTNSYTSVLRGTPSWNQLSPFATGSGYKNRVYTWTSSGSITF